MSKNKIEPTEPIELKLDFSAVKKLSAVKKTVESN